MTRGMATSLSSHGRTTYAALVLPALFSFVIGVMVAYWLIRTAVSHGMQDALRRDRLSQQEAELLRSRESID